jgi:LysM repeat protein
VNEGTPLKLLKYDPNVFTANDIEFQFPTDTATAPTMPTASECDYPIITQCGPHYDAYTGQYDTGCVQGHYETGRFVQNRTNCSRPFPMPSPSPTLTPALTPARPLTATLTSTGGEGTYTVEAGDTVYAIALKFGITVEELASANNMTVEQIAELSAGQKLIIPQRAPEQQPVATATPDASGPPPTATPAASGKTYTVQEGDIPVTIAEQFGISVEALLEANDITDSTSLKIGQVLVIPMPTATPSR